MRIDFNGECRDVLESEKHNYDLYIDGIKYDFHWCYADEEEGLMRFYYEGKDGKKKLGYNDKPIICNISGKVELRLKNPMPRVEEFIREGEISKLCYYTNDEGEIIKITGSSKEAVDRAWKRLREFETNKGARDE